MGIVEYATRIGLLQIQTVVSYHIQSFIFSIETFANYQYGFLSTNVIGVRYMAHSNIRSVWQKWKRTSTKHYKRLPPVDTEIKKKRKVNTSKEGKYSYPTK